MKIVIKVGTQAILAADGTLKTSTVKTLVRQIAELRRQKHDVILVSSGAVSSGRRVARDFLNREFGTTIGDKQVLSSLGQPELMAAYTKLFRPFKLVTAQLLLTKQDFHTRQHYLNIARLLREILAAGDIIPIINENDSVAIEELMFTDNDELSGLIAAQLNADKLIILTSVKGIFDGPPDEAGSKLIPQINPDKDGWPKVSTAKTAQGRGGMMTKLGTARKMSDLGITTHIASLHEKDVLLKLLGKDTPGTTILPKRKKSNLKKWIAYSESKKKGIVHINAPLFKLLCDQQRVLSILPVGIKTFSGSFEKGDMVDIAAPNGKVIGMGIARYSSEKLKEYAGEKGSPVFIHYDHLHIKAAE